MNNKTDCRQENIPELLDFQALESKSVTMQFDGGAITTDGGVLFLREMEKRYGIIDTFAQCFLDYRNPFYVQHSVKQLLMQRVFGLCLGYEDLNDQDSLRHDPAIAVSCEQTPSDTGTVLAGKSTLHRLETCMGIVGRYKKIDFNEEQIADFFIDTTIRLERKRPKEIVLDFDATHDPIHGNQEGKFFNGYYDCFCYLPLYVFWGDRFLYGELRQSSVDPAEGVVPVLKRIVSKIRKKWPGIRIVFRGDSGFCREEIMTWCEKNNLRYVIGLRRNKRLERAIGGSIREAKNLAESQGKPVRIYRELRYRTRNSWSRVRRVVAKAEYLLEKANPRFIVTNISKKFRKAKRLYEKEYCGRGDMENRIKEQHLDLFGDRTSSHTMRANQLRLWFSALAYVFMNELRKTGLAGTEYVNARCETIRLKLLKLGARIKITVRRIVFLIGDGFPYRDIFFQIMANLQAG